MLGIADYLERKPAALSGGQRQRVAMGRAIVREPRAFLMDEPLSNLDAKLRVSMRASLAQLHERLGVTTVYVTHDQVEAMTLGQRVCVLRDGQLQQVDSPQALYSSRRTCSSPGFIGSPAMNFVSAELVRSDGPGVAFAGHVLPLPAIALAQRPRLSAYLGQQVILGIRPADFEDARFADPSWPVIATTAEVTEELGSEIHVLFSLPAPPVRHPSITDAQKAENGDDNGTVLSAGQTLWTARVSARSSIRPGQPVTLAIDTANLQFFDPDSGLAIGHPGQR